MHILSTPQRHRYRINAHQQIDSLFRRMEDESQQNENGTLIFTRKRTNIKPFGQLKIDGHPIQPEKVVMYLGLQLDTRLNLKHHIKTTVTKGNAAIRILYPLLARNSANSDENKLIIYKQIIRPLITYEAPVWGHSSNYTMEPLKIFQNMCMKLITGPSRFTRIRELQAATGLPPIKN